MSDGPFYIKLLPNGTRNTPYVEILLLFLGKKKLLLFLVSMKIEKKKKKYYYNFS